MTEQRTIRLWNVFFVLLLALLPGALFINFASPDVIYENLRLYSVVDEMTAVLLFMLVIVLLFQPVADLKVEVTNSIMACLLTIAIFFECKSFTEHLPASIWLDSSGLLIGGLFLLFPIFRNFPRFKKIYPRLPMGAATLSIVCAAAVLRWESSLPPARDGSLLSHPIRTMNFFSSLPYLFATGYLYLETRRNPRPALRSLAFFFFYFGTACFLTPWVHLWGPKWWLLQLYQLIPAMVIVAYIARHFREQQYELALKRIETEKLYEELKLAHDRLENFSSTAAHDLKSPLRNISTYAQLIQRTLEDRGDESLSRSVDFIVNGADRLRHLIDDLLAFSRSRRVTLSVSSFGCREIVEDVLHTLAPEIENCAAEIAVHPLPTVKADRFQLTQLFQNLIGNAIKYRGTQAPKISISCSATRAEWIFAVKDNGIGVGEEKQRDLFEPFKRGHSTEKYEGTGLGLTICRTIVERHRGKIWMKSNDEGGSTFYFALPKEDSEKEPSFRKAVAVSATTRA